MLENVEFTTSERLNWIYCIYFLLFRCSLMATLAFLLGHECLVELNVI